MKSVSSVIQLTEGVVCSTRQGDLLGEMTAMTRRQGSPVTAICADEDCNIIVTGDHSKCSCSDSYFDVGDHS